MTHTKIAFYKITYLKNINYYEGNLYNNTKIN